MSDDVVLSAKKLQVKIADEDEDFERIIGFYKAFIPDNIIASYESPKSFVREEWHWFFVETDQHEMLAVASVEIRDIPVKLAYIDYFFVREDARKHRIGPLLMSALIKYCKSNYKNLKQIQIGLISDSWRKGDKIKILDRLGFVQPFSIKSYRVLYLKK